MRSSNKLRNKTGEIQIKHMTVLIFGENGRAEKSISKIKPKTIQSHHFTLILAIGLNMKSEIMSLVLFECIE